MKRIKKLFDFKKYFTDNIKINEDNENRWTKSEV